MSKEETSYCVMDGSGKVLARGKVASDPEALFEMLRAHCLCPERIVLETGTLSNWLGRELRRRGLPVEVIDARRAHAVTRVRRAHPLKDWARKLKRRTGHKKACVALARKLAIILHRMWISGEDFAWPRDARKEAASAYQKARHAKRLPRQRRTGCSS